MQVNTKLCSAKSVRANRTMPLTMTTNCHVDLTLPLDNDAEAIEKAKDLVVKARPEWKRDNLRSQWLTGGITNKILSFYDEATGKSDRVLLRIYGKGSELVVDRNIEIETMKLMHSHGCAPPLHLTFGNGLAYGFVPGIVTDTTTVRDDTIFPMVCKAMASMHSIPPPESGSIAHEPCLFKKIRGFIANIPDKFDDTAVQKKFIEDFPSKEFLEKELEELELRVKELESPVVFAHNDLLLKNIIYTESEGKVTFIDYEYAGFNYQAFDIADHFTEFAGVDDPDFSLYPDKVFQMKWLKTYLGFFHELNGKPEPSESDVERLFVQVNILAAAAHFLWSIWAVIQAKHSVIDFGYLQYGIDRFREYSLTKESTFQLSLPPKTT